MKLETQQPVPQTEVPGSIPETVVAVDLAKRIVGSGLQTDAFLLANEDQLLKNCAKLAKDFKGVLPYFGKLKNFQKNRESPVQMKSLRFEAKKPNDFDRNQNKYALSKKEQPNTTGKKP